MAWDDAPPTKAELASKPVTAWDALPPSEDELSGKYGKAQTAIEHGGNAIALGYGPQLQAGAEKGIEALGNAKDKALNAIGLGNLSSTDAQLKSQGFQLPEDRSYVSARDANVERLQEEEQENKKTAIGSKIGGGIIGAMAAPLPGGLVAKGIGGGIIKGAGIGAGYGLLQNPGDVKGEVNPLQAGDRAKNAAIGAAVGGVGGGVTQGVASGLNALKNSVGGLRGFANDSAVKASGAMLKDFRQLEGKGAVDSVGQFARDKGLVKAGDTFETIAQKANALREDAGSRLDSVYKKATQNLNTGKISAADQKGVASVGFNPVRDKEELLSEVADSMGNVSGKKAALSKLGSDIDQWAEDHGDTVLDPKTTQDIKTEINKVANWARNPMTKEPATEGAYKEAMKFVSDKIDNSVDLLGKLSKDPKALEELKAANHDYGMSKQITEMAKDRALRESANMRFGLTDRIAGSAGGAAGSITGAALGGALNGDYKHAGEFGLVGALGGALGGAGINKLSRTYGNAALAGGAGTLSKVAPYTTAPIGALGSKLMPNPNLLNRGLLEAALLEKNKGARP